MKEQSAFSTISGRHSSVCARPEKSGASYQFLFLLSKYRNVLDATNETCKRGGCYRRTSMTGIEEDNDDFWLVEGIL